MHIVPNIGKITSKWQDIDFFLNLEVAVDLYLTICPKMQTSVKKWVSSSKTHRKSILIEIELNRMFEIFEYKWL